MALPRRLSAALLAFLAAAALLGILALAPAARAYPVCCIATGSISSTVITAGKPVTVTVQRTTPGPLTMQIESTPVTIGTGSTGTDGSGSVTGTVPASYVGAHTIHVVGAGGEVFDFTVQITPIVVHLPGGPADGNPGGLASTGAQVALASGVGLAVLLAGTLVMLAARPRRTGENPRL